jgi:ubiquinone/menaquinone biosynthesis C-methylase UbiE
MRTAVGSSDSERLRLESELWQDDARALLELAAPAPDAACLDAGCGPAGALLALSRAAPKGRVVGLDIDHGLLEDARALLDLEQVHPRAAV